MTGPSLLDSSLREQMLGKTATITAEAMAEQGRGSPLSAECRRTGWILLITLYPPGRTMT